MMVKICGITTREDAVAAAEAGAHALGFNFYPASPRFITPSKAAEIGAGLELLKVGVFVNESPAHVAAVAREARLDIVQLHGTEHAPDFVPLRIWKAQRVNEGWRSEDLESDGAEAILLDGPAPGTGAAFDWNLAKTISCRLILAGGLGPDNVTEAILQVRPWGVDACSRLEKSPGLKDHERMRRFIQNAMAVSL